MTPEVFCEKFHIRLNTQQMEAVRNVEGQLLLLAVPGSGKTTVLVTRLGYMIYCCGIRPENILTVTYTVAATRDMAVRFRSIFGGEYADRLEFRTINGICTKVIQYYGTLIGKTAFELVTDEKKTAGMLTGIYQRIQKGFATESELKNIRTLITYIKNRMLSEEELEQLEQESEYKIAKIYREYCSEMRKQGLMDYDDQMTYAYRILRSHRQTREYFQHQYPYICVDEAQDTSKIQFAILELLAEKSGNLFLVGDEDQSIYGFRAACPEELLKFDRKYPFGKILLMEENFRSNAEIVSAADGFIQKNLFRHEKHMKAFRPAGSKITRVELRNRKEQYDFLLKTAKYTEGQTAVLYRDNESVLPLVDLLEREGVSYRMRNAELTFFSHRVVLDIQNILRFSLEPGNIELFLQIYYKMNLFLNKQDANTFCELSQKSGLPILEAAMRSGYRDLDFSERITRVERISAVHRNLLKIAGENPERAISMIENQMGYREYLERMGIGDGKLFVLKMLAAQEADIEGFLKRLVQLQERIREKENSPDCQFILSTIHASKGLEYERVYLMDVADGIFPECVPNSSVRSMLTPEDKAEWETYEEERRIFYVGVTRAKEELYVMDWKQKSVFVRGISGEENVKQNRLKTGISSGTGNGILQKKSKQNQTKSFTEDAFRAFCNHLAEGLVVEHKVYGKGTVAGMDETYISIAFEKPKGETSLRNFQLKILFENHLLCIPE